MIYLDHTEDRAVKELMVEQDPDLGYDDEFWNEPLEDQDFDHDEVTLMVSEVFTS